MADKEDSARNFNPRHRIVGAIILIAAAVIFVPLLLDERAPPAEPKAVSEIAPRPTPSEGETRVVVSSVPTETAGKTTVAPSAPAADAPPAAASPAAESAPGKTKIPPATVEKTKASSASPAKAASGKPADKPAKGWVVQVGTFANPDNAERLRERLKRHGHAAAAENVTLEGSKAVRLRVGPFHDRPAAVKAQAQIRKEIGINGVVLASP